MLRRAPSASTTRPCTASPLTWRRSSSFCCVFFRSPGTIGRSPNVRSPGVGYITSRLPVFPPTERGSSRASSVLNFVDKCRLLGLFCCCIACSDHFCCSVFTPLSLKLLVCSSSNSKTPFDLSSSSFVPWPWWYVFSLIPLSLFFALFGNAVASWVASDTTSNSVLFPASLEASLGDPFESASTSTASPVFTVNAL